MIKKSIVFILSGCVLFTAYLIMNQTGTPPSAAVALKRRDNLWFMRPWKAPAPGQTAGKDGRGFTPAFGASEKPDASKAPPGEGPDRETAERVLLNREAILAPAPALDAVVAELEQKDLETGGRMTVPTEKETSKVRRRTKPHPKKKKKKKTPKPAGPIRFTALSVAPSADGARLRGATSTPAERMDLLFYTSPPHVVLELYGEFAQAAPKVAVPENRIFKSVDVRFAPGKARIVGMLKTAKANVAPMTESGSRNDFEVKMILAPTDAAEFIKKLPKIKASEAQDAQGLKKTGQDKPDAKTPAAAPAKPAQSPQSRG